MDKNTELLTSLKELLTEAVMKLDKIEMRKYEISDHLEHIRKQLLRLSVIQSQLEEVNLILLKTEAGEKYLDNTDWGNVKLYIPTIEDDDQ